MTSLVTEVLLQAGKLDKVGLQTRVSKLTTRSTELHTKIDDFVKKKYAEINPMFSSCQTLLTDITEQQRQAKDIHETLSGVIKTQLQDSTSEFQCLTREHSQTSELLFALGKICEMADLFDNYANSKNDWKFEESASALLQIQSILESIKNCYLCDVNVFKFLKQQFTVISEGMRYNLDEKWMNDVSWTLPPKHGSFTQVVLKIPLLQNDNGAHVEKLEEFQDLIYAMKMLGRLKPKVQRFSEMVMKYIFTPLIDDQSLKPDFDHDKSTDQISLKVSLVKGSIHNPACGTPDSLFQSIFEVLDCLHLNLLRFKVNDTEEDSITVMSIFSELVRNDLLQLLVDKCLALTIPKSLEELENYKEVADVVKKFESALASVNFIPAPTGEEPGNILMAYASNVSFHFTNLRCTDILSQARILMKKASYNTKLVSDKNMGQFEEFVKKSKKISSEIVELPVGTGFDFLKPTKLLCCDTLRFPECHVSTCAIDLMTLAYKTMHEASQSEPGCAVRLVTTTQHIFELYHTAYPIFHKDSLENLPQFSAVFHNDCMYLAHHLLTFGHQFSTISPLASKFMRVLTFVDKVPLLRRLGAECILNQMKKQKDVMISCLEPLRIFTESQNMDKYNMAEKAIKQILYQLNHLKKIWSEVQQEEILHRAMCNLVNSCVAELVSIICEMEDISADDSISLRLICLLVSDQIPSLFKRKSDESDLPDLSWQKQVWKWPRLQELILMLSGSLREIVDRWSEGKGPLATAFSITEVKGLIRALFQNTEHRAQAISQIRL